MIPSARHTQPEQAPATTTGKRGTHPKGYTAHPSKRRTGPRPQRRLRALAAVQGEYRATPATGTCQCGPSGCPDPRGSRTSIDPLIGDAMKAAQAMEGGRS